MENQEMMENVATTIEDAVDTTAIVSTAEAAKTNGGSLKKVGIVSGAIIGGAAALYGGYLVVKRWVKPAVKKHQEKVAAKKAEKKAKKAAKESEATEIDPNSIDTTIPE